MIYIILYMIYNIKTTQDLLKAKSDNAKTYWKMLKGNKSLNFSTIDTNEFKEYFCSLLNPDDIFYEADDDIKHFLLNYSDEEVVRIFDIMNVNISMEELEKAISQLKNGKSGGGGVTWNVYVKYLMSFSKAEYLPNPGLMDYLSHSLKRGTLTLRITTGASPYWVFLVNYSRELWITDL